MDMDRMSKEKKLKRITRVLISILTYSLLWPRKPEMVFDLVKDLPPLLCVFSLSCPLQDFSGPFPPDCSIKVWVFPTIFLIMLALFLLVTRPSSSESFAFYNGYYIRACIACIIFKIKLDHINKIYMYII